MLVDLFDPTQKLQAAVTPVEYIGWVWVVVLCCAGNTKIIHCTRFQLGFLSAWLRLWLRREKDEFRIEQQALLGRKNVKAKEIEMISTGLHLEYCKNMKYSANTLGLTY